MVMAMRDSDGDGDAQFAQPKSTNRDDNLQLCSTSIAPAPSQHNTCLSVTLTTSVVPTMKHALPDRTREAATYKRPCVHEGFEKKIPTASNVWPCDLCTVLQM